MSSTVQQLPRSDHGARRPPPKSQSQSHPPSLPALARDFLDRLTELNLLTSDSVVTFLETRTDRLAEYKHELAAGEALVEAGLLTRFQLDRVLTGRTHGLLLGNYRVLEQLGSGGMGQVFLGEHCLMKRRVAIKVLPLDEECHHSMRQRFYAEMRVLAELHHPNIVLAFDAGEVAAAGPNMPALTYLVMELVCGGDLERHVEKNGPVAVPQACDWVRQAAQGLQAAHDRHLVHRDVKPSNLLLTSRGQVKLVDFGLARQFCSSLTDPRALLGSIEFMAPEQSHDPTGVATEADIYGLGATFFWLLTGEAPYPFSPNVGGAIRALQRDPPRRLRELRPDAPAELDDLVARMLHRDPARRIAPPLAISTLLAPFTVAGARPPSSLLKSGPRLRVLASHADAEASKKLALIVDADAAVRVGVRPVLEEIGCACVEAPNAETALGLVRSATFDLLLTELRLPGLSGQELLRRLREMPGPGNLQVLVASDAVTSDTLTEALRLGANDFLPKPFDPAQLRARAERALRVKEGQDRAAALVEQLRRANLQLDASLEASKADLRHAHDALLFAMAKMAESRDGETPGHLRRLQRYVRTLAEAVANEPLWLGLIDGRYLEQLERCVPLHDIGKIGLPDHVLLKRGTLSQSERSLVQTHPLIGDRMLESLGEEHGGALDFLGMARAIVRHHHERFDGKGYPDGLRGDAIPPAARLAAVADVYDALRRQRLHKPAMSHPDAVQVLLYQSSGQFDPTLLRAFQVCHQQFERIFREVCE